MHGEQTFAVTMMRAGPGLPFFEVGAYRYTAERLPTVGDVIAIVPVEGTGGDGGMRLLAYVTRVEPTSDTPIRVTEAAVSPDAWNEEYIVAPGRPE